MNKIYKIVWNKARQCYMVVCEYAKSQTKGCSTARLFANRRAMKGALAGVVAAGLTFSVMGSANAADPIYVATEGVIQVGTSTTSGSTTTVDLSVNSINAIAGEGAVISNEGALFDDVSGSIGYAKYKTSSYNYYYDMTHLLKKSNRGDVVVMGDGNRANTVLVTNIIGSGNKVNGSIDENGYTTKFNQVIGNDNEVYGQDNIVIGDFRSVGKIRTNIDSWSETLNDDGSANNGTIVIGNSSTGERLTTTVDNATVLGTDANVSGKGGVALGYSANVSGEGGVALGYSANVSVTDGVALGDGSNTGSAVSTTAGYDASTKGTHTLGYREKAYIWTPTKGEVSVGQAAGYYSKYVRIGGNGPEELTKEEYDSIQSFSKIFDYKEQKVEIAAITRRITNVAAGAEDTDAVNVAQLKLIAEKIPEVHYFSVSSPDSDDNNYYNDGAMAPKSIAIGKNALTYSGSNITGGQIAIGSSSIARDGGAVALGLLAKAQKENALALGALATATVKDGVALGYGSVADTPDSVPGANPMGVTIKDNEKYAWTSTAGAVSVGRTGSGEVGQEGYVAPIYRQITNVAAGTALTDAVNVAQLNALKQYVDEQSLHFKGDNVSKTEPTLSYGPAFEDTNNQGEGDDLPQAKASNTVNVLGRPNDDAVVAPGNIVVSTEIDQNGNKNLLVNTVKDIALLDGSINITNKDGSSTVINGGNTTVKNKGGNKVEITGDKITVNKGNKNVTIEGDKVDMGGNKIINVAPGENPGDVVTVEQLKYTVNTVTEDKNTSAQANVANKYVVKEQLVDKDGNALKDDKGNEIAPTTIHTIVDTDTQYTVSNTGSGSVILKSNDGKAPQKILEVGYGLEINENNVISLVKTPVTDVSFEESDKTYKGDVGSVTIAPVEALTIQGGATEYTNNKNIAVVADNENGALNLRLAQNIKLGDNGSVEMGDTSVNNKGLTINKSKGGKKIEVTGDNISMGDNQVHDVEAGTAPTDAVNVSQLKSLEGKVDNRINKVGARAAALAALHPLDFDPDDKLTFAAGYGHYKGENAGAIGAFYRPDEKVMFSVAGTVAEHDTMINAGISFSLDRTPRQTTTKTAMARDILEMKQQIAALAANNKALTAQNNQFLKVLGNATGLDGKPIEMSRVIMFPDVPENHWAYEYVEGLMKRGIIEGYPDGNYSGDRSCTRYEFAAMLYRALKAGQVVPAELTLEFASEIGRFRVDRVHGADDSNHKIERIRVNGDHNYGRDNYGSKNPQPVTSRGPQYPESAKVK